MTTQTKIHHNDLQPCEPRKFPKGAWKGFFYADDRARDFVGYIYVENGQVFIGRPRECGRGEVTRLYPEPLDPKAFKFIGRDRVSASRSIKQWTLR